MPPTHDICELTLAELSAKLAARELSSVEATGAALARTAAVDPRVHAFLKVDEKGALAAAAASDGRLAAGRPLSPLDGVPLALKDLFVTDGVETTAGSKILKGFVPPYDGTAVARLKQAGAVLTGKLAMDEFAMGSSNENTPFAAVHNPWDLSRVPGGSSGGSAAAVAAREVFGALGTDTGGSIRQPASLVGIAGLKPTYGRVSRYGVVAFASSLDQVGPMARTSEDCALMLSAIAGLDPLDSTSADLPVPDYRKACARGVKGLRLGVPREYFVAGMDGEVERSVRAGIETLRSLGATVREISLPHTGYAVATYYIVATAEASSNLARYDGVKYGFRAPGAQGLRDLYLRTRAEGFGPEVKRRIMLGTYVLSAGYYDAYYLKAQKVRTLIRRDFEASFEQVDAIVCPTSPVPAFAIGERASDPLQMYLADIFTISCNLAGLPGLSVPCGFTAGGLPIGLQILGRPFDEETLFAAGGSLERELRVHAKRPPI
ncbi:MAG: Asp-tRNA(Asn)/Glu-tRNA(Gln) amidotransferase subunit GatA [Myxococcales bacterium]